jgi:hypothetical protein
MGSGACSIMTSGIRRDCPPHEPAVLWPFRALSAPADVVIEGLFGDVAAGDPSAVEPLLRCIEGGSQVLLAAIAVPMVRVGAARMDQPFGLRLVRAGCWAARSVTIASLRLDAALPRLSEFCEGEPQDQKSADPVVAEARRLLVLWIDAGAREVRPRYTALARRLEQEARQGPRVMPFSREHSRLALQFGILLQLARYDELVTFGRSLPNYATEVRRAHTVFGEIHRVRQILPSDT